MKVVFLDCFEGGCAFYVESSTYTYPIWNIPHRRRSHLQGSSRKSADQATYVKRHAPCKHAFLPEAGLSAYVLSVVLSTTYSVFQPFGVTVKWSDSQRAYRRHVAPVGRPSSRISLGRIQSAQRCTRGRLRGCGFELAKALIRELYRYPNPSV